MLKDRQVEKLADAPDLLGTGHLFLSSQFQNIWPTYTGPVFIVHLMGDLRRLLLTSLLQIMLLSFQDKEGTWVGVSLSLNNPQGVHRIWLLFTHHLPRTRAVGLGGILCPRPMSLSSYPFHLVRVYPVRVRGTSGQLPFGSHFCGSWDLISTNKLEWDTSHQLLSLVWCQLHCPFLPSKNSHYVNPIPAPPLPASETHPSFPLSCSHTPGCRVLPMTPK